MDGQPSLYEHLIASGTLVDYDSLDFDSAKALGRVFRDCTSNQAILDHEFSRLRLNHELISTFVRLARSMPKVAGTTPELVVELIMVHCCIRLQPFVKGNFLVQINPNFAYSKDKIIANAKRLVSHFSLLQHDFDTSRVCIKIPATWEGLWACHSLEASGIKTLATIVFSLPQVALAGHVGCHYIAPYVRELPVHFNPNYVETGPPDLHLLDTAQRYFKCRNMKTQVMAASLTATDDIMRLAGVNHMTLAPKLIAELIETRHSDAQPKSIIRPSEPLPMSTMERLELNLNNESAWRLEFTESRGGKSEAKMMQALGMFFILQTRLEFTVSDRMRDIELSMGAGDRSACFITSP